MKINELRGLDNKNLDDKLIELKSELIKINAQIAIGTTPKNPGLVKTIKKSIARVMGIKTIRSRKKNATKAIEGNLKTVKKSKVNENKKTAENKKISANTSKTSEVAENKFSVPPRKTSEVIKKHE